MTYQELVDIVALKNLAWQCDNLDDRLELYAYDGPKKYEAIIFKPGATAVGIDAIAEAANLTDFNTNYKSHSNFAIGNRLYPFSTPDMQFAGKGFKATFTKGQTTDAFFVLSNGFYLSGGEYFTVNAVAGDTLIVDIVDKDGLYTPAGTVLVSPPYLDSWNIPPKDGTLSKFERTYAAKPPPGVYLRFRYTSVGADNDVAFYCNLYNHKPL